MLENQSSLAQIHSWAQGAPVCSFSQAPCLCDCHRNPECWGLPWEQRVGAGNSVFTQSSPNTDIAPGTLGWGLLLPKRREWFSQAAAGVQLSLAHEIIWDGLARGGSETKALPQVCDWEAADLPPSFLLCFIEAFHFCS